MLHCPNEHLDSHPPNADIRFFADAVVEIDNYCLVRHFVEFLPTKANCGWCMAEAVDDEAY